MREQANALGVGALVAATFYLLDPSPSWWLAGLAVTVVLLVNPRT